MEYTQTKLQEIRNTATKYGEISTKRALLCTHTERELSWSQRGHYWLHWCHQWQQALHKKNREYLHNDAIMSIMASQITSVSIVCSTIGTAPDQRKYQSSASLNFCAGNSPVTGDFPAQKASNAKNASIWWCHHDDGNIESVWIKFLQTHRCMTNIYVCHLSVCLFSMHTSRLTANHVYSQFQVIYILRPACTGCIHIVLR